MADCKHPRLILRNFLSLQLCKELEFIHKSCCTVGYRPNVFSTTLFHLIATNCAHLIMPLIPIRERLKEEVEEYFGCEYELFVEFTGLISWCKGSSIGWHSDNNRPYLKQRDFAAVCYLNSYNVDFKGGVFHFQDGEPTDILPMAGDAILYTADDQNIHCVDEVTDGERVTLTLWFSRDASHDEESKLISFLSQISLDDFGNKYDSFLPIPSPINMYWFPPDEASKFSSGFDIRCGRLHVLGFELYSSREINCGLPSDSSSNLLELLKEPLQLAQVDELSANKFANVTHALQVVLFYCWKFLDLKTELKAVSAKVAPTSETQRAHINRLKCLFVKDPREAETLFGYQTTVNEKQYKFDWASFSAAVSEWEAYTCRLHKELLLSLPHWRTHQSIFFCPHEKPE
nr:prolyl 3-hydroxylase 1 isoform X1 [Ipomoea batatas]